jgi:nucleotidyltransferase substrate binding protein (TIGR01987 family)
VVESLDILYMTNFDPTQKIIFRMENFQKALLKLEEIHDIPLNKITEIERDAFFQRYEFCVKLAWKVIKDALEFEKIEIKTPRESIKEAFKIGLIDDYYVWDEMLNNRNYSSHNYDEVKAIAVFLTMHELHFFKMKELEALIKTKYLNQSEI